MAKAKKKVARPPHKAPAKAKEQSEGRRSSGQKTFDNTNRGALFLNDKDGNDARPDYTGTVDVKVPDDASPGDLVKFRVAGWTKTPNSGGDDFLSLSLQEADKQGSNKKGSSKKKDSEDDDKEADD